MVKFTKYKRCQKIVFNERSIKVSILACLILVSYQYFFRKIVFFSKNMVKKICFSIDNLTLWKFCQSYHMSIIFFLINHEKNPSLTGDLNNGDFLIRHKESHFWFQKVSNEKNDTWEKDGNFDGESNFKIKSGIYCILQNVCIEWRK